MTMRGDTLSAEARAKVSASLRGRKLSPETIAKRSASVRGQKRSAEFRAFISAANRRERHPNWKGGRTINKNGYVAIPVDRRPGRISRQMYEHRLIGERVLGRPLKYFGRSHLDNEVVHHINGIKSDNRNENLLICTARYHNALHRRLAKAEGWSARSGRIAQDSQP